MGFETSRSSGNSTGVPEISSAVEWEWQERHALHHIFYLILWIVWINQIKEIVKCKKPQGQVTIATMCLLFFGNQPADGLLCKVFEHPSVIIKWIKWRFTSTNMNSFPVIGEFFRHLWRNVFPPLASFSIVYDTNSFPPLMSFPVIYDTVFPSLTSFYFICNATLSPHWWVFSIIFDSMLFRN